MLKAQVLIALYSVRSDRLFCETLDYNILFRWFLDMSLEEPTWDASTFSKNRDRLLEHDVATKFFDAVVRMARQKHLLSDEHFTVDGTLVEAWTSMKSFPPKGEPPADRPRTLGADKGYDTRDFVSKCRGRGITPQVAANTERRGGSAIDGRTTRHAGYAVSQRLRKRVEEIFGWSKTVGGMRRSRFKGRERTQLFALIVGTAYNLMRMARILREPVAAGVFSAPC